MTKLPNNKLALLHIAAQQLGIDDDTYRDVLEAHAGVRSAKNLDYQGFRRVMTHFEKCGFRSRSRRSTEQGAESGKKQRAGSKEQRAKPRTTDDRRRTKNGDAYASEGQLKEIYRLWYSLGIFGYYRPGNELKALRGFLRKRFRVDHENFLTLKKAGAVIEAMKGIGRRAQSREHRAESKGQKTTDN